MLIAQISDLHIGKTVTSESGVVIDPLDRARVAVKALNGLWPRLPDLVIASGDLVCAGTTREYAALGEVLAELESPLYLMPGNHDDRRTLRECFNGHDYLPAEVDGFLNYEILFPDATIIALDTVIPGEVPGELCERRLAWLEERLEAATSRPVLLFLHHPPFKTGVAQFDAGGFGMADELARLVSRHERVRGLFCGHVHRAIETRWAGVLAAVAPSASYAFPLQLDTACRLVPTDEPPGCRLILCDRETGPITHTLYFGRGR